jgi:hypothetical protein
MMLDVPDSLKAIEDKLGRLAATVDSGAPVKVMIAGLGSVGSYLLDYLINLNDARITIHVAGRTPEKMEKAVNIARTAASIRGTLASRLTLHVVDLGQPAQIGELIGRVEPDFVVNSSRAYSGTKYGGISWHAIRAYGIWAPLSVKYVKNIACACAGLARPPILINTSYSDATNRWVGTAGLPAPDFGSGNLNHLVPRIKFAVASELGVEPLDRIDVTLATSHFHDVLISKEGATDGCEPLLHVAVDGRTATVDASRIYRMCAIPMPTDHTRNMMNASSNFEIVWKLLRAAREKRKLAFHSPGVAGLLGGYPVSVDGANLRIDEDHFDLTDMTRVNRASIAMDGVESVEDGVLTYTDDLLDKTSNVFGCELPKRIELADSDAVAELLIDKVIRPGIA